MQIAQWVEIFSLEAYRISSYKKDGYYFFQGLQLRVLLERNFCGLLRIYEL